MGKVLRRNLSIVVGDGRSIKFWTDLWIGDKIFKVAFPRLFPLSVQKDTFVVDLFTRTSGAPCCKQISGDLFSVGIRKIT